MGDDKSMYKLYVIKGLRTIQRTKSLLIKRYFIIVVDDIYYVVWVCYQIVTKEII